MQNPHELMPTACRAAARVLRNPLLIEEAAERAVHALTLAILDGQAPLQPRAWIRTVAKRSACALLRSDWVRTASLSHDDVAQWQAPYQSPRGHLADLVRERCEGHLTPRQTEALEAMLSYRTTRAAAQECGMQPRDFRRYLRRITEKAQLAFAGHQPDDPYADDAAVQFRLPS